jgi:hypothetical protein
MKRIIVTVLWFGMTLPRLFAGPIFITSTFSSGNDGWQPDNWQTTGVNGLSPGNPYLKIAADGSGALGKMITFNPTTDWTGDYVAAGVTGIRLDIANMSDSDDVYLRVALGNRASPQQPGGTWWISKTPVFLSLGSGWTSVVLPIAEADMVVVGNIMGESDNESFADTFSDIQNIRILSAAIPVGAIGDEFVGDVGVDNIALVPEPTTLPLVGVGMAVILLNRRRKTDELPDPAELRRAGRMR